MSEGGLTGGGWRPSKAVAAEDTETRGGHRPRPATDTGSSDDAAPRPPTGGGGVPKPPPPEEEQKPSTAPGA